MMTEIVKPIVLLVDDLMFLPRLENLVRHAGYEPIVTIEYMSLTRIMVKAPSLAIVDLMATSFDWAKMVRAIRGPGKKNDHLPVLGFGPHVDLALREKALESGCTAVVGRGAITTNLAGLIEKHVWRPDPDICGQALHPLAQQAIVAFNEELFFECHEIMEDAWNDTTGPLRMLYQGILQIGVGYLHITRHNWRGAVKVLERGIPKAAHFRPVCQGVDVADLIARAQAIHTELLALGPEGIAEFNTPFPKIKCQP